VVPGTLSVLPYPRAEIPQVCFWLTQSKPENKAGETETKYYGERRGYFQVFQVNDDKGVAVLTITGSDQETPGV